MPPGGVSGGMALGPARQVILKVHSRCDLSCDYCYVYEGADQSWVTRPRVMSPDIARAAAERIRDHAVRHELDHVSLVLHGGEPLLLGARRLGELLATFQDVVAPATPFSFHLQTNGVRLDEEICDVLADFDVKVGVSLDGDRRANDRHRRSPDGRSSYERVLRALALLRTPPYRALYSGILATVDVRNDAIAVYESLLRQEPPRIDFLLPHATWDQPPPRPAPGNPVYGEWLARIFDRWTSDGRPVPIRLFDSLLSLHRGGPTRSESVGPGPFDLAVVETDGTWELPDSLKVTYPGAPQTGLDVVRHSLDDVLDLLRAAPVDRALHVLCDTCRACPIVATCGGGLPAHRYRRTNGFQNPSVYCDDLRALIPVVGHRASALVASPRASAPAASAPAATEDVIETAYRLNRRLTAAIAAELRAGIAHDGWQLLVDLDSRARRATRVVLGHPYVRVWARRRLVAHVAGDREAHTHHLAALAAAAAVHAGAEAELTLGVLDGAVHLPTLGTVLLPDAAADRVSVTIDGDGFTVAAGAARLDVPREIALPRGRPPTHPANRPWWRPLAAVETGGALLLLDDADPYRDCYPLPVTARLEPAPARRWWEVLTEAWHRVGGDAGRNADGAVQLTTVTPLRPGRRGRAGSSRASQAAGALGLEIGDDVEGVTFLLAGERERLVGGTTPAPESAPTLGRSEVRSRH